MPGKKAVKKALARHMRRRMRNAGAPHFVDDPDAPVVDAGEEEAKMRKKSDDKFYKKLRKRGKK